MDKLWSAATIKLIGAGVHDASFCEDLSRLVGEHDVPTWSDQRGVGHRSSTLSTRRDRILSAADIAALPKTTAVLISAGRNPGSSRCCPGTPNATPNRSASTPPKPPPRCGPPRSPRSARRTRWPSCSTASSAAGREEARRDRHQRAGHPRRTGRSAGTRRRRRAATADHELVALVCRLVGDVDSHAARLARVEERTDSLAGFVDQFEETFTPAARHPASSTTPPPSRPRQPARPTAAATGPAAGARQR